MQSNKPQRSNFDLICGMILGALVVGLALPITTKYLAEEEGKARKSLRARAPIAHEMKKKEKSSLASANVEPASISLKLESMPKTESPKTELNAIEKDEAAKPKAAKADSPKKIESKAKPKPSKKVSESPKPSSTAKAVVAETENLEELASSETSDSVARRSDETMLAGKLANDGGSGTFISIPNASYLKDQLANCPKHCLLKINDSQGVRVNAVINGPAFAEALLEHQGTVNLIGVKRVLRNYEFFMVQSITYNLPNAQRTASAPKTTLETNTVKKMPQKGSDPAWEDLSEDTKNLR